MSEAEFYEMLKVQMEMLNKDLERVFALWVCLIVVFMFFLIIALFLWTYNFHKKSREKTHKEREQQGMFSFVRLGAENTDKKKCEKDNKCDN